MCKMPLYRAHMVDTFLNQFGRADITSMRHRSIHQVSGFFCNLLGLKKAVRYTNKCQRPRAREVQLAISLSDTAVIHSKAFPEARDPRRCFELDFLLAG